MLSDLFQKDFRQMTSQGVKFTAADIVRLNALAVRVKLSANPVGPVHARRAAFWCDFTFREPTLGHEMWIEQVSGYIDISKDRNFRIVHAYALTREHWELPDAYNPKRCIKAVYDFARKHLAEMTSSQLTDTIDYVLFGADWTACELAPPKKRKDGDVADAATSPALGVFVGMSARKIPLSLDEAKKLTASEILEIVNRVDVMDRKFDQDRARSDALSAYVRAREEIRGRGREVKV